MGCKSQIWEGIVGNTEVSKRTESYVYSFKMAQKRDPNANSMDNKIIRKKRVKELSQCLVDGYEWVCIDETRFDVGYIRVKGRSKKGKRLYIHRKKVASRAQELLQFGTMGFFIVL